MKLKRLPPYLCILVALFLFYFLYTYGTSSNEGFVEGEEEEEIMIPAQISHDQTKQGTSHLLIEVPQKITCQTHEDCNVIYGRGKNQCIGGQCQCTKGAGTFCHRRPNYYKDPKEMSPEQIIKFKKRAKLEKMTLGDYKNWLTLFKHDQESLPNRHLANFQRLMMGQIIYDIPLSDPVDEFFADAAAKKDRVCLEIPNAEIDSPLNWKIRSQLNNTGKIDHLGRTERPLNWSRYYKHPSLNKDRYQRSDQITAKDWFLNNVNWMFYDVDRNSNYQDPNLNRFMNVIDDSRRPQPGFKPQRLLQDSSLVPTQEGTIAPASNVSNLPSKLEPSPVALTSGIAEDASYYVPSENA